MNFYDKLLVRLEEFLASAALGRILPGVVITLIGLVVVRLLLRLFNRALERSRLDKAAHSIFRSILKVLLYAILALIVASTFGVDVTSLVALLSVVSLAVSLSVQDFLTNIIGGITLLTTKPFKSGDFVQLGADSGTVTEIGMTYTKLRTGDNKTLAVPNSIVVGAQVINYTEAGTRRVDLVVSAAYTAPTEVVKAALLKAAQLERVMVEPAPFVGIKQYGDHAISYDLRVWCDAADYWDVYYAINERIRETFAESGVEMTYPHLNVHIEK